MSGRLDNDDKLINRAKAATAGYPPILERYLTFSCGSQASTKVNNINTVKRLFNYLTEEKGYNLFDKETWAEIDNDDIEDYFVSIKYSSKKGKELSNKTATVYLITIRGFFDYLVSKKYIVENPCPTQKELNNLFPTENNRRKVIAMTPEEVHHVVLNIRKMSKMPKRDECLFLLGCRTGMRARTMSEIDISDINFEERYVTITEKRNKTRDMKLDDDTIRLMHEAIAEAKEVLKRDDIRPLFITEYSKKGDRLPMDTIGSLIARYTFDLDKHITPHKMRSTCITIMYEKTGNIYACARQAGHSKVATTALYINNDAEDRELSDMMGQLF